MQMIRDDDLTYKKKNFYPEKLKFLKPDRIKNDLWIKALMFVNVMERNFSKNNKIAYLTSEKQEPVQASHDA